MMKPQTSEFEWDWFRMMTHVLKCEDTRGLVVYEDDGNRIAAMAVCDSFTHKNGCNVHLAIKNMLVLRHGFIEEVCRYAFIERGCRRIFGMVAANNLKSLKFTRHLGMQELTRIPNGIAEGEDYVIMGLERDDCRWLPVQEVAA